MVSLSLTLLVRQSLLCPSASTVFCFISAFPASEITFHIFINILHLSKIRRKAVTLFRPEVITRQGALER